MGIRKLKSHSDYRVVRCQSRKKTWWPRPPALLPREETRDYQGAWPGLQSPRLPGRAQTLCFRPVLLPMPTQHPLIIKRGLADSHHGRLETPQVPLTVRRAGGYIKQAKVYFQSENPGRLQQRFQKGEWPSFLGTVGRFGGTPLPELPSFREPWLVKVSPDALQVALPISTHQPPLPTSVVGVCSLGRCPVWLANVQAVTAVKYFECHHWHLPKFSGEVLYSQDCL